MPIRSYEKTAIIIAAAHLPEDVLNAITSNTIVEHVRGMIDETIAEQVDSLEPMTRSIAVAIKRTISEQYRWTLDTEQLGITARFIAMNVIEEIEAENV